MTKATLPALWTATDVVVVPPGVKTADQLTAYAKQLSPREAQQIVRAFEDESFEIASSFVWQKSMAGLKKKLGALGMDFVAEMLSRPDIVSGSDPVQVLTDNDALRLAEELGFFPSTQMLRLRNAMSIVSHFADPPPDAHEGMAQEEAFGTLRACIQTVLGHTEAATAIEFAKFRKSLEEKSYKPDDHEVQSLSTLPYFFRRTTLRVLIAVVKTASGGPLEHAVANLNAFLPPIWPGLLQPDRESVGWCYAELHALGKETGAAGVRAALLKVRGFDYVPESLRSRTYLVAAQKVIDAHFGWSNFHNEPAPMAALESLGSTIPAPALAKCMTAILCVKLGNPYGVSWAAEAIADRMLGSLAMDRWAYYAREVLPGDDLLLAKLTDHTVAARFCKLAQVYNLSLLEHVPPLIRDLLRAAHSGSAGRVADGAVKAYQALRI